MNLLIVFLSILTSLNGFIIYIPNNETNPDGSVKPTIFVKLQDISKLDCNVTNNIMYDAIPKQFNCSENLIWHFEIIKSVFENSTTNKCEEMNVMHLVSKKYIIPVSSTLMKPILISNLKRKSRCDEEYSEGLNYFSYKLNNITDVWTKTKNIPLSLQIRNDYPLSISEINEEVMFDQMVMIGLQMGVLDLPFPYELEIAKEKFSNGTFKTLDELRVVSQETINRIGNELFKKSCISRNSLINSLDSAGNITDIMRAILDRTDIKAERMDTSIKIARCKVLGSESVKYTPIYL